ncbi:SNARE associated Golgi protein [Chlorobaculum parvum NCIB 8327]|uniref:SNARE associated Golgi protein n=1 Tax=Chlorobaculum parvum (strain DSM 263 / NCIMB 8327) TaxID=517417 RepID=B3QP01_CHLP8|nr:DedA family protein [Chlorobaculum parvum]ACF11654.1 SNARE associated Golgi protein [Chlorobaculum parvum NCIB 8327]
MPETSSMLESVVAYLQQAEPSSVYAVLFLSAYFENVIPPIPGDVPVALAGYLLTFSHITVSAALFWSTFGSVAGFMTVFLLSRFLGLKLYAAGESEVRHKFARSIHKLFPPSEMEAVRQKFSGHGYMAVLVNRFLFGSRAVICIVAGMLHLKIPLVLAASFVSSLLWNILLLSTGYLLGSNWDKIGQYAVLYTAPFTILFTGFIIWKVVAYLKKRKQQADGA